MAKITRQTLHPEDYYEYQPEFGVWSVHFENIKELSIEKVTKIFKKYGAIKNVSQTGSKQGYCFISYWRREDAKNCVQQVSNDGIRLRPFSEIIRLIKDKQLEEDPQMFEAMKKKPIQVLNVTPPVKTNDKNNNVMAKNDTKKYEKYWEAKSVFFANPKKLSIHKIRGIFSKYGYIETIQQTGYPTGWCFVRFGDEKFARECAIDIMSKGLMKLEEFKPAAVLRARKYGKYASENDESSFNTSDDSILEGSEEHPRFQSRFGGSLGDYFEGRFEEIDEERDEWTDVRDDMIKSLEKLSKHVGKFVKKVIMNTGRCFYVPMESRVPWERLETVSVEKVPAEGILVGNIHESCGAEYLMKVFEKLQPLYVSKVKEIDLLNCCFVYVKTEALATAAVRDYDNSEVYGRKLIVVRNETLRAGGGNRVSA